MFNWSKLNRSVKESTSTGMTCSLVCTIKSIKPNDRQFEIHCVEGRYFFVSDNKRIPVEMPAMINGIECSVTGEWEEKVIMYDGREYGNSSKDKSYEKYVITKETE